MGGGDKEDTSVIATHQIASHPFIMAQRKLQGQSRRRGESTPLTFSPSAEIDRTLKKVHEGVQIFEDMYDKFMMSTNATQKDKLETDLKTQIKKLQRMRDQVKSWQTSNDIKDKQPLDQTRRTIETVSCASRGAKRRRRESPERSEETSAAGKEIRGRRGTAGHTLERSEYTSAAGKDTRAKRE